MLLSGRWLLIVAMFKPEIDVSDLQPRNSKYFNLAQFLSADKLVICSRKFTDNNSRLAAVCRGSRLVMAGELDSSTFTKDGAIFDTGVMLSNSWLLDSMSSSSFVHLSIPEMSRSPALAVREIRFGASKPFNDFN